MTPFDKRLMEGLGSATDMSQADWHRINQMYCSSWSSSFASSSNWFNNIKVHISRVTIPLTWKIRFRISLVTLVWTMNTAKSSIWNPVFSAFDRYEKSDAGIWVFEKRWLMYLWMISYSIKYVLISVICMRYIVHVLVHFFANSANANWENEGHETCKLTIKSASENTKWSITLCKLKTAKTG